MINYIKIVPRVAIEFLVEKNERAVNKVLFGDTTTPWALISIFGLKSEMNQNGGRDKNTLVAEKEFSVLKEMGCIDFHNSCFMDITKEQYERLNRTIYMENMLFNENRAQQIIDFVNKVKDSCERLVIHCDAGVSRSGATGLWASRYLGLDEKKYCDNNTGIQPNPYVLEILSEVSGMKKEYEAFWMNHLSKLDTIWE